MTKAEMEKRYESILRWLATDADLPSGHVGKIPVPARKLLEIERDRLKVVLDEMDQNPNK